MVYVWITETDGRKRYVDDRWLNPCYKCGEQIAVCQKNDKCVLPVSDFFCIFCSDEGCGTCKQGQQEDLACDHGASCTCDEIREEIEGVN